MSLQLFNFLPVSSKARTYTIFAVMLSLIAITLFFPEMAFADYKVSEITSEFDEGEEPVGTVAAASAEMLVIRRIWRIIKSSI